MNKHPYYSIDIENGARIVLTPCPGTQGLELEASIKNLKQAGAMVLLTLMFDEEITRNHIELLPDLCKKYDITWIQLPIVDDDVPNKSFEDKWKQYHALILATIINGGCVTIHCKGGKGRTGLVAAMILTCYGWSIEKVIGCIQKVRPEALRVKEQLAYIRSFSDQKERDLYER
ncbi:MAG: protein-tyrosine phosphatase [Colwellia sp.]|jgi:protein-tyrosine phosphatase|tara:strand:- start:9627 stop:10148 length:522 start_codon:yes stop_codon:yes gene_type:complete